MSASTPSSSFSPGFRLLYRGALALPDSFLLLDGLTFVARLETPSKASAFALMENPLALALESMRGRPSLRFLGTVRMSDLWLDESGGVEMCVSSSVGLRIAILNKLIGISILTLFSLACILKTCSVCLLSPLALNAPKSGSKSHSATLVRVRLPRWIDSDSEDRWRNDRDRCLCSNHLEFDDVALHDREYGNNPFRTSVRVSNDPTGSCANSTTARDSSSETTET